MANERIVAEAETSFGVVKVVARVVQPAPRHGFDLPREELVYDVRVNDVNLHPGCDAEAAMRALAHYLQGESYRLQKAQK
jgi:hypothetical protein